jgi:hypothetical protein
MPMVGELVHESGVLMALRKLEERMAITDLSRQHMRVVDPFYDQRYHVQPGGRIIEIKAWHENRRSSYVTPVGLTGECERYAEAYANYRKAVIETYHQQKRLKRNLTLTNKLYRFLVESMARLGENGQGIDPRLTPDAFFRREKMQEFRLEFTVQYEKTPDIVSKITDMHGGKAVVCSILDESQMPFDHLGRRAELVFDPLGTNNRMNIGRLCEHYLNSVSADWVYNKREILNIPTTVTDVRPYLEKAPVEVVDNIYDSLIQYYRIVSPVQYNVMTNFYKKSKIDHLTHALHDLYGFPVTRTGTDDITMREMYNQIQSNPEYKPVVKPIYFYDEKGILTQSTEPIVIASVHCILLEKDGGNWAAASSARLQANGFIGSVNQKNRHLQPFKNQGTRTRGEAEVRIEEGWVGPLMTAEQLDRNTSVTTHAAICEALIRANHPTQIQEIVDRSKIPLGQSRPLQVFRHLTECSGIKMVYRKQQE